MPKWRPRFASHLNFLDPQQTNDGRPYAPVRYKEIVKECYLISKNIHTSYTDLMSVTPTERNYMLEFLIDEARQREALIEKRKAERAARSRY